MGQPPRLSTGRYKETWTPDKGDSFESVGNCGKLGYRIVELLGEFLVTRELAPDGQERDHLLQILLRELSAT